MNSFTQIPGRGKFPRAVRELQREILLLRPGQVPGARVSLTPRGFVIEPDGSATTKATVRRPSSTSPRWG